MCYLYKQMYPCVNKIRAPLSYAWNHEQANDDYECTTILLTCTLTDNIKRNT